MDIAKLIKDLRESTGMSRKEFSEHTGIPVRTLEDWEDVREYLKTYVGEFYMNAATGIPEMIEISVGKHFRENREKKA